MRQHIGSGLGLALIAAVATTGAVAEDMSSEEILRRLQMQQQSEIYAVPPQGGTTRGLALSYGRSAQPVETTTRGITLYQGEDTGTVVNSGVELAPMEPMTSSGSVSVDSGMALPVATTPIATYQADSVLQPVPISLDTYQPVQESARIDLRIYFEWNSASLKPSAIGQLSQLCSALQQVVGQGVFKIIGHTDKSGSDQYNLYLSEARAREVKRHLVEECAVPRDSLLAVGEGERQSNPGSPQRDPAERRVEVQLVS